MGEIRFIGRARGGRCVYCHDSLAGAVQTCPECSATWHDDCGDGAPRCPTRGCSGPAPGTAARPGRRRTSVRSAPTRAPRDALPIDRGPPSASARFGPYSRLVLSALLTTLGAAVATAYLLWPIVHWSGFWHMCSTDRRGHPQPAALGAVFAIMTVGFALLCLLAVCSWLRRIPAVFREVSSLLDDTTPTAMRLSVTSEGSGKHIRWTATLVGDGQTLSLSLGGLLPPGWLRKKWAYVDQPVLVYGLPPPGPYIIEFRDGALALVHPD